MRIRSQFFKQLFLASLLSMGIFHLPAANAQAEFNGVWSGVMTTQENLYWGAEDFMCFPGCPKFLHDYLGDLLDDSANDERPTDELVGETFGVVIADRMARSTEEGKQRIEETNVTEDIDMSKFCAPYGFVREALNALPIEISQQGENLLIKYEEFNLSRTIYMDGRAHPENVALSPLGFSTGRIEDGALLVETSGISGDYYIVLNSPTGHYGSFADGATAVERYEIIDDPRRIVVDLTITEPVTLNEPYTWTKTWLYTPEIELLVDDCSDVPGQI